MAIDPLKDDLEDVFSILPEDQAEEARLKTLQNFMDNRDLFKNELKWANFDQAGMFCGAGASDIGGFSSRVITQPDDDPQIQRLVELASEGGAIAGLMEHSPTQNCIYWFLPTFETGAPSAHSAMTRGLVVPEILFQEVLDLFNAGRNITQAERHLAFQITAGQSLRDAATSDGLAFETKRAQLKSLCAKMQCSGQNNLLRLIMGQMTYLLSISGAKHSHSQDLQNFASAYLNAETRMVLQRLPNERSIQILEIGPVGGQPVLLIHGMLWPLIFTADSQALNALNVRLIMPLRAGYLGQFTSNEIYGRRDMTAESLEDIADFHRLFLGEAVPVVGHSYGGALAIRYAHENPDLISKLFVVSIYTGEQNGPAEGFMARFFGGLRSLSNQKGMFRYLTWQFKKYYADEKIVTRVLRNMFASSRHDSDALEGKSSGQSAFPWFVEMYQKSIPGIADDFEFVMGDWEDNLERLEREVSFIHGEDDPIVPASAVQGYLAKSVQGSLTILPDAGHHIPSTHSDALWRIVTGEPKA